MVSRSAVVDEARRAIDAVHAADPEAKELAYADSAERWVERLLGSACTDLDRLAARCQHLERWALPRSSHPEGKAGYLKWRKAVHQRQGDRAKELLLAAGVAAADADRVAVCVAKQAGDDPMAQTLEDIACLIFLDEQIDDFAAEHADYDEAKWLGIIRKTWAKMSPAAHEQALQLQLSAPIAELVKKALA